MAKKRLNAIIEGLVQATGYRDIVVEKAIELDISGIVRNTEDKKVEVIAEGEEKKLNEFLKSIKITQYPIIVKKIRAEFSAPTNEFSSFEKIIGDPQQEIIERADVGAKYTRVMVQEIKGVKEEVQKNREETRGVREEVKGLRKETQEVKNEVKGLRKETHSNFTTMDKKYGAIHKDTMNLIKDSRQDRKEMKELATDIRQGVKALTNIAGKVFARL